MNALTKKLGIKESQIINNTPKRAKGKETTDSDEVKQIRKQMHNVYNSNCKLVNNADYYLPKYKRDKDNKFLLDKEGKKAVEGWTQKSLAGQFIVEDNEDGTHTLTKLNVYKETFQVDSNSLRITKVTNN